MCDPMELAIQSRVAACGVGRHDPLPSAYPILGSRFCFLHQGGRGILHGELSVIPLVLVARAYCPEALRASQSNSFNVCKTSQHNRD
jgi:hypothetical protein